MRTSKTNLALGLGLALASLAVMFPPPARAQSQSEPQSTDARWLPWLGCWQAEGSSTQSDLVCIRPASAESSVEILRMNGTEVASHEMVWADGARHETTRDGCTGWEKGTFSKNAQRVFLSSKYTCQGGTVRTGGGIMALVSPTEWLDVRYVGMGSNRTPWVQKYRVASAEQTKAAGMSGILAGRAWSASEARRAAASPPTVADVIEASKAEPPDIVKAWLAVRNAPLRLDAKALERMADAGVAPSVTDMAVAVSYPNHFRVNTGAPSQADHRYGYARRGWGAYGGYYNPYSYPFFYDPFYAMYGFSPFGYAFSPYAYGYSPYGYGGWYGGGYLGGYGYGYTPVITITNQPPRQHGRVIAGRGYTRGGSSGGGAVYPSSSGTRTSGSYPTGTSGSAGTSSGSTGGHSTGRTAHRRGGGGGL